MKYSPLLQRQIKKFLQNKDLEDLNLFLEAVNQSYIHFERDNQLSQQSLAISSKELQLLVLENEDSKNRLKAILDAASDGILVINKLGEIEVFNKASLSILGYTRELTPKNICEIEGLNIISTSTEHLIETNIIQPDGKSISLEISTSQLNLNDEILHIFVLRDISTRKQAEKKMALRHQITYILSNANELNLAMPLILKAFADEIPINSAIYWDENKSEPAQTFNAPSFRFKHSVKFRDMEPQFLTLGQGDHYRTSLAFPIYTEETLFGMIELLSDKYPQQIHFDFKILKDIGAEIGLYIERQIAQEREQKLQSELIGAAKQAGMSQVANSVLHNVGNVLNSVNISATLIQESIDRSEMHLLTKLADLIENHIADFPQYVESDPKGKLIPQFLIELNKKWHEEHSKFQKEITSLADNIQNIKNIIKSQQSISCIGKSEEKVSLSQLIDDILKVKSSEIKSQKIQVIKKGETTREYHLNKTKLSQVLINLINNAIDAMSHVDEKLLTIEIKEENNKLSITLSDNGCGFSPLQKDSLFTYGFTTKKEGHGFGLHSSQGLMREMNGSLSASSPGINQGASFTINLS